MPKIKIEIEVPNGEYCDCSVLCPLLENGHFGQSWCPLYGDLEVDNDNGYYLKRCDKCKQAEVKDENSSN